MDEKQLILKRLGERIKAARKGQNLTQLDLEIVTGISNQDISKIEKGRKDLHFTTVVRIANALGITLNDLYPPESK
ncbi:helix-turn-helix domain-containing protein [Chitinophaga jiangningensis]|uniref:helix-turn-helix domain-containing protein n=1 Tax=Chitinophaga jiangningensis TaxID=1419482 RepID=UPI000932E81A|nr:helix-turn-helix transcriptional regulator [Chitinophaga jiangningensis]